MPNPKSYRDLDVWQKSVKLAVAVYSITANFPKHELFGLTAQMRRAVVRPTPAAIRYKSGNLLTRFPDAAKIAFATAGATGETGGSPRPDGGAELRMKCT